MVLQSYISIPQYNNDGSISYVRLSLDEFTNTLPSSVSSTVNADNALNKLTNMSVK